MRKILLSLLAGILLLFSACKKETTDISHQPVPTISHPGHFVPVLVPPGATPVTIQFENGKKLGLFAIDTSYILEGDMVLTKAQIEHLKEINSTTTRTYRSSVTNHWRLAEVPFVINNSFSLANRNNILTAINDWQASSSVRFVPRTFHSNYIEFMPSSGNNSNVGMIGERQVINLVVGVFGVSVTSCTHEIGHALGMFHEQSRADRDNFIQINWANIRPAVQFNFNTYAQGNIPGTQFGAFDFNSIMLYPSFIGDLNFVFDPNVWVMADLNQGTWGTNFFLSNGDLETAAIIYGPPFARVEYQNVYNYNEFGNDYMDMYSTDDIYVRLYADAQCTIPFTTPSDFSFVYNYYQNTMYSNFQATYTGIVPAGNNNVLLWNSLATQEFHSDYGNPTINNSAGVWGASGFFRY